MKAEAERSQPGAIMVTVDNGDQCQDGWTLLVNGKSSQTHRGQSGVVSKVYPGLYKITVKGTIANNPVQAETMAKVAPGEIISIVLTLT